ncbi:MAG: sigma-70 family RNA polymerase sigma factor [Acidimicrobiia bacterium]|nr:sigma-70 family RNA polymerase sigma factor [Acidimicrobiia bacterium]
MEAKLPFEDVVIDHGITVLRVCRAVVGPVDADDAWSEAFLSAMRAYPNLPSDANVQAWLVTIAHRKAIDILRRSQRGAVPVENVPETVSTMGVPDIGDTHVWQQLRRLPDKQRQAIAYHHVAGLSYDDVAEILGGTAAAARRAASDGIRSLRNRLSTLATGELHEHHR